MPKKGAGIGWRVPQNRITVGNPHKKVPELNSKSWLYETAFIIEFTLQARILNL